MTGPSCGAGCDDAAMPTGAEVIVAALEDAGVEVVFGLPGVHNLALWEALRRSPIRLVGVRHEQAAAYAADGYARATGRLGVALTTTGPGAANTLGAVGEAWASRSPMLVIATDIPSDAAPPGRLPRRAARDHRPGGDVRARRGQGRRPRRAPEDLAPRGAAAVERRPACAGRSYLEVPTDLLRPPTAGGRRAAGAAA